MPLTVRFGRLSVQSPMKTQSTTPFTKGSPRPSAAVVGVF